MEIDIDKKESLSPQDLMRLSMCESYDAIRQINRMLFRTAARAEREVIAFVNEQLKSQDIRITFTLGGNEK